MNEPINETIIAFPQMIHIDNKANTGQGISLARIEKMAFNIDQQTDGRTDGSTVDGWTDVWIDG